MSTATSILSQAGLPTGPAQARIVEAWIACESLGTNNPLSVTGNFWSGVSGSVLADNGGNPVFDFLSLSDGISANAQNLRNGSQYGGLRAAIASGNAQDFVSDPGLPTWGTNPACVASRLGASAAPAVAANPAPDVQTAVQTALGSTTDMLPWLVGGLALVFGLSLATD